MDKKETDSLDRALTEHIRNAVEADIPQWSRSENVQYAQLKAFDGMENNLHFLL